MQIFLRGNARRIHNHPVFRLLRLVSHFYSDLLIFGAILQSNVRGYLVFLSYYIEDLMKSNRLIIPFHSFEESLHVPIVLH
jgi:hypothetical protein